MWRGGIRLTGSRHEALLFLTGRWLMFAALVCLWQSFFWLSEVPLVTRAAFFLLTVFACARPAEALLVVAGLATLGGPAAGLTGALPPRGAEALALSFLVGWLARLTVTRQPWLASLGRLAAAALMLGFLVVSSLIVTVVAVQQSTEPARAYAARIVEALSTHYLGWLDPFIGHWHAAALWLEGLLLLAATIGLCRARPGFADRLVRVVAVGIAAAGILSCLRLAMGMLRSLEPAVLFESALRNQLRLTFHTGDLNAAGSHFLLGLFIVLGVAFASKTWRGRFGWMLVIVPVVGGLWLSGSRTAMLAGGAAAFATGVHLVVKRRAVAWAVLAATVLVVSLAALSRIELPKVITEADVLTQQQAPFGEVGVRTGMATRLWFLQTSYRMWLDAPIFGVGIGQYVVRSPEFMPGPLKEIYSSENAHNYFAQVATELGFVGFVAFVWLLWAGFAAIRQQQPAGSARALSIGVTSGLAAYLLTCLAGHPLLVDPVAYSFWIVFGASLAGFGPSSAATPDTKPWRRRWVPMALAILLLLVPFRIVSARQDLDLSAVRYGFSVRQMDPDTGDRFWLAGPRASVFIPVETRLVTISVAPVDGDSRHDVQLLLDNRPANRVRLEGRDWTDLSLIMPTGDRGKHFRRLDIVVLQQPGSTAVAEGGSQIRVREVRFVR